MMLRCERKKELGDADWPQWGSSVFNSLSVFKKPSVCFSKKHTQNLDSERVRILLHGSSAWNTWALCLQMSTSTLWSFLANDPSHSLYKLGSVTLCMNTCQLTFRRMWTSPSIVFWVSMTPVKSVYRKVRTYRFGLFSRWCWCGSCWQRFWLSWILLRINSRWGLRGSCVALSWKIISLFELNLCLQETAGSSSLSSSSCVVSTSGALYGRHLAPGRTVVQFRAKRWHLPCNNGFSLHRLLLWRNTFTGWKRFELQRLHCI